MARRKKSAQKRSRKHTSTTYELPDTKTNQLLASPMAMVNDPAVRTFWKSPSFYIGLVVIALAAFLFLNKSWWLAGLVNGKPIFRWSLNRVMGERFGKQTLEGMISEQLIAEEAQKAKIGVSQQEVDAKVTDITKGLGENVNIDDLLKLQGMSRVDLEKQLRLQLTVEKILGKNLAISDQEIADYIATNSAFMTATDEASLNKEASEALRAQKINEKMQAWFVELKEKAKILRFL